MAENPDDNDVAIDPVQRAVDERIRREALRQLNTIDIEDDHSRVESLDDVLKRPSVASHLRSGSEVVQQSGNAASGEQVPVDDGGGRSDRRAG
jgi:predicted HAD superfamily phosphohydrolase